MSAPRVRMGRVTPRGAPAPVGDVCPGPVLPPVRSCALPPAPCGRSGRAHLPAQPHRGLPRRVSRVGAAATPALRSRVLPAPAAVPLRATLAPPAAAPAVRISPSCLAAGPRRAGAAGGGVAAGRRWPEPMAYSQGGGKKKVCYYYDGEWPGGPPAAGLRGRRGGADGRLGALRVAARGDTDSAYPSGRVPRTPARPRSPRVLRAGTRRLGRALCLGPVPRPSLPPQRTPVGTPGLTAQSRRPGAPPRVPVPSPACRVPLLARDLSALRFQPHPGPHRPGGAAEEFLLAGGQVRRAALSRSCFAWTSSLAFVRWALPAPLSRGSNRRTSLSRRRLRGFELRDR